MGLHSMEVFGRDSLILWHYNYCQSPPIILLAFKPWPNSFSKLIIHRCFSLVGTNVTSAQNCCQRKSAVQCKFKFKCIQIKNWRTWHFLWAEMAFVWELVDELWSSSRTTSFINAISSVCFQNDENAMSNYWFCFILWLFPDGLFIFDCLDGMGSFSKKFGASTVW